MNDPLPTEEQRKGLNDLVADALVEIRMLASEGRSRQILDLAEAFHEVPKEMYGWGAFSWQVTRGRLVHYQARYHHEEYLGRTNYLWKFDAIVDPDYSHARPHK